MSDEDELEDELLEKGIAEHREQIGLYLATQSVQHGAIGEVPARVTLYLHVANRGDDITAHEGGNA